MSLPGSLEKVLKEIVEASNLRGASIRAILLCTTDGAPLGRRSFAQSRVDLVAAQQIAQHAHHGQGPPNHRIIQSWVRGPPVSKPDCTYLRRFCG
jgi:hypothetical protein